MTKKKEHSQKKNIYTALAVFAGYLASTACGFPQSVSYEQYLQYISLAEKATKQQDITSALLQYDTAFSQSVYAFGQDIEAALHLAVKEQDEERVITFSKMLLQRVCPVNYFKAPRFTFMENNTDWQELLTSYEHDPAYLKTIDISLRTAMIELYSRDQNIALNFKNANVHPRYQQVTTDITNLEQQYGFPGEAQTGVRMENDGTIGRPYYYVILLHHYHKKVALFYDKLSLFVEQERLDPRHYAIFIGQGREDEEIVARINASRKVTPKTAIQTIEVPIFENRPIYEDSYLYPQEGKGITRRTINDQELILIDWNNDSIFTEVGVDYYGFEIPGEAVPRMFPLKSTNRFERNGQIMAYDPLANTLSASNITPGSEIPSFLDEIAPIQLSDGQLLEFADTENAVIYFWASWCAPCIRKLIAINNSWDDWSQKGYRFIPVALQSDDQSIVNIYQRNAFQFPLYIGEENTAKSYWVSSFPTAYLFEKGRLKKSLSGEELLDL